MSNNLSFNNKGLLKPGVYKLNIAEVQKFFGSLNSKRVELFNGLFKALKNMKNSGIKNVYIDGSFITTKEQPNDIDGCWDYENNIDLNILDSVFLDFKNSRKNMKLKYGVDFFIANTIELGSGMPFVKFFQSTREGEQKGIILIELNNENF
jgi:hypothetical protein